MAGFDFMTKGNRGLPSIWQTPQEKLHELAQGLPPPLPPPASPNMSPATQRIINSLQSSRQGSLRGLPPSPSTTNSPYPSTFEGRVMEKIFGGKVSSAIKGFGDLPKPLRDYILAHKAYHEWQSQGGEGLYDAGVEKGSPRMVPPNARELGDKLLDAYQHHEDQRWSAEDYANRIKQMRPTGVPANPPSRPYFSTGI